MTRGPQLFASFDNEAALEKQLVKIIQALFGPNELEKPLPEILAEIKRLQGQPSVAPEAERSISRKYR